LLGTSIGVDGELEVLLEGGSGDGAFLRVNDGADIIVLIRTGILHLLHEGEFGRIKGAEADVFFGEGGTRHCRELCAFLLSKNGNQFLSVMIEKWRNGGYGGLIVGSPDGEMRSDRV
jgi:hypothetical protein